MDKRNVPKARAMAASSDENRFANGLPKIERPAPDPEPVAQGADGDAAPLSLDVRTIPRGRAGEIYQEALRIGSLERHLGSIQAKIMELEAARATAFNELMMSRNRVDSLTDLAKKDANLDDGDFLLLPHHGVFVRKIDGLSNQVLEQMVGQAMAENAADKLEKEFKS